MNSAQDYQGTPLSIGDKVACTLNGYSPLITFIVVDFTEQKIRLARDLDDPGNRGFKNDKKTYLKFPVEVIKAR